MAGMVSHMEIYEIIIGLYLSRRIKVKRKRKLLAQICSGAAVMILVALHTVSFCPAAESEDQLETIVGVPGNGYRDGIKEEARFASPHGLDVRNGIIVIADTDNHLIRSLSRNRVITMAGRRRTADVYGSSQGGFGDNNHNRALFNSPVDCVYLDDGTIVVADRDNHSIRAVGKSWVYTLNGIQEEGYQEGKPGEAKFSYPSGIAKGPGESIYVADTGNHCIRMIDKKGVTSLVAGVPGQGGLKDGAAGEALFLEPTAVVMANDGSLYVADSGNQRIRKISGDQVSTVAGGAEAFYLDTEYREPGLTDGKGRDARFWFPEGICMADDVVVVADTGNHVIRAVSPAGQVRIIAGNGEAGYQDGSKAEAMLNRPTDVVWENGTLYIMDSGNCALRSIKFDPGKWLQDLGEK